MVKWPLEKPRGTRVVVKENRRSVRWCTENSSSRNALVKRSTGWVDEDGGGVSSILFAMGIKPKGPTWGAAGFCGKTAPCRTNPRCGYSADAPELICP